MTVLQGTVQAPPSKSVTHRAYILAAQSDRPCNVARPLRAADTEATLAALHALGHKVRPGEAAVEFRPAPAAPPHEPLDCRNAGTSMRLLAAAVARHPFPVAFTGDDSLATRPNGPLLEALRGLGARVDGGPTIPFTVQGPARAGTVRLPGGASSQYASGLLLVLPFLEGPSTLTLEAPVHSAPYLDLTRDVAAAFGLRWDETVHKDGGRTFRIEGGQVARAAVHRVEGDWSAAAFPLVGAAITGGTVTVQGLDPASAQGDRALVDHLQAFGCRVDTGPDRVTVHGGELATPGVLDVAATPDLFPALAVLAACTPGTTTFRGGGQLRAKESDRIHAMAENLDRLGVKVDERHEGLVVRGGRPLQGASLHAHHDHRIHMALRLAALVAEGPVEVDGADTVAISYPQFHEDLERLTEASP